MDGPPTRSYGLLEGVLAAWRARIAERLVPPSLRDGRLLDLGCGTTPRFLLQTQFAQRVGVDPEVRARPPEGRVSLLRADVAREYLPFRDGSFAVVTMLAVVEHLTSASLARVFAECCRVLQPGGRLILTWPAPWTASLLRVMARCALVSRTEIADHKANHSPKDVRGALEAGGFGASSIAHGHFQLGANTWLCATK
jgi:SAM-dependent methyltransferase